MLATKHGFSGETEWALGHDMVSVPMNVRF